VKDAVNADKGPLKSLNIELEMEMESPMLHSKSIYCTIVTTRAIMTVDGADAWLGRDKNLHSPPMGGSVSTSPGNR